MWKPLLIAVSLLASSPVSAQFVGPSVRGQPTTVAQVEQARIGSYVTLTGNIVDHQRSDYFTFRDSSGQIRIEVSPQVFAGRQVTPETTVRVMGEIDRGLFGRYVWVKSLDIVS